MRKIATLGGINRERAAFERGLIAAETQFDAAAACIAEPVRVHLAAGIVVGGEFPDGEPVTDLRGERIGRVMILVRAFERSDPDPISPNIKKRAIDRRSSHSGRKSVAGSTGASCAILS